MQQRQGHSLKGVSRCDVQASTMGSGEQKATEARQGNGAMTVNWQGVFPAATTQFHDDQSLD